MSTKKTVENTTEKTAVVEKKEDNNKLLLKRLYDIMNNKKLDDNNRFKYFKKELTSVLKLKKEERPYWKIDPEEKAKFFQNTECEHFPCHPLDDNLTLENFNCIYCFCPLYKTVCGHEYGFDDNGNKDCSNCSFVHHQENVNYILRKLKRKTVL